VTARVGDLPATVTRVACRGERHAIRWESGDLVALDHEDAEGERALVALGGASCACLDVLCAWSRQRDNPGLLTALSRGTQDPVQSEGFASGPFLPYPATTMPRNMVLPARGVAPVGVTGAGWVSVSGTGRPGGPVPGDPLTVDLALLAGLGHQLTARLVATVTAGLLDGSGDAASPKARAALEASLFGRAWCALRDWLAAPELEVELTVTEPHEEPGLEWDASGPVRLALPLEWVVTVWGRDVTVVAGRFALGVAESTPSGTTLVTVGPDLGPPRHLAVDLL
jgi:hypothetical protein